MNRAQIFRLHFLVMITTFTSIAFTQECAGLSFEGLKDCLKPAEQDLSLAITNSNENVSLALIKNKEVVFQERGLGYVTQPFSLSGKKVEYSWYMFNVKKTNYFLIRTRGDNTSMLYVYRLEGSTLKDVHVTKGIHTSNLYITTTFASTVEVVADTIHVNDRFFEARFVIDGDHLNNSFYKEK